MQTLVEFFGTLSASAAIAAIIQFWFKKRLQASIDHEYNLAIERHKAELSRQNAIEIEQIKHNYNLSLEELKAKFSQELEKTKSIYNNGAVARKSVYDAFSALYCYCIGMQDIYMSEYSPEHEHHIDDYKRCFNQTCGILKEFEYFLGSEATILAYSLLAEHRDFFEPLNYRFQLKKSSGGSPNVQASPKDNYSAQLAWGECKTQIGGLNMSTQKLLRLLVEPFPVNKPTTNAG